MRGDAELARSGAQRRDPYRAVFHGPASMRRIPHRPYGAGVAGFAPIPESHSGLFSVHPYGISARARLFVVSLHSQTGRPGT